MPFLFFMVLLFCNISFGNKNEPSFQDWVQEIKNEAIQKGFSQSLVEDIFDNINAFDSIIYRKHQYQPERKFSLVEYQKNILSEECVTLGKKYLKEHELLLEKVFKKYRVPPEIIVALWGIESRYGSYYKPFDIIPALITLSYKGRRKAFFKRELFHALRIIEEGHISLKDLKGSYAGAIGQIQFMPSSYHAYAVDGNGDFKKNIWNDYSDIFYSAANYLKRNQWKENQKWGMKVRLPRGFSTKELGLKTKKTVQNWKKLGVLDNEGLPLSDDVNQASIIQPDSNKSSQAYLVYYNFEVLLRWNRSLYFGTTVGLLANLIKGIENESY